MFLLTDQLIIDHMLIDSNVLLIDHLLM